MIGDHSACEDPRPMCQQIKCPRCGKPTWTGCGRHIEQALANVPAEKRCACPPAAPAPQRPILERIFGSK